MNKLFLLSLESVFDFVKIKISPINRHRNILDKIKDATRNNCNPESKLSHLDNFSGRNREKRYEIERRSFEATSWRRTSVHTCSSEKKRRGTARRFFNLKSYYGKLAMGAENPAQYKGTGKVFLFLFCFFFRNTHYYLSFFYRNITKSSFSSTKRSVL